MSLVASSDSPRVIRNLAAEVRSLFDRDAFMAPFPGDCDVGHERLGAVKRVLVEMDQRLPPWIYERAEEFELCRSFLQTKRELLIYSLELSAWDDDEPSAENRDAIELRRQIILEQIETWRAEVTGTQTKVTPQSF